MICQPNHYCWRLNSQTGSACVHLACAASLTLRCMFCSRIALALFLQLSCCVPGPIPCCLNKNGFRLQKRLVKHKLVQGLSIPSWMMDNSRHRRGHRGKISPLAVLKLMPKGKCCPTPRRPQCRFGACRSGQELVPSVMKDTVAVAKTSDS